MLSESIIGKDRLGTTLRVLCGVAAVLVLYISAAFWFDEGPSRGWVLRAPVIVGFILGIGLAVLTILGRRSPLFESVVSSAYEALTRVFG